MAKITLKLDKRSQKKDKTYPIKIFVRNKGTMACIATPYSVEEKDWVDGRISPKCKYISNVRRANNKLTSLYNHADDQLAILEDKNRIKSYSAKQIVDFIINYKGNSSHNFLEYMNEYIPNIKNDSTREKYFVTYKKIIEFIQSDILFFDDISLGWLNRYKEYRLQNVSATTTNIDLRNIRAIFNRAIDIDEIISQDLYPFRKFQFVKTKPRNLRLSIDKIRQIRDLDCNGELVNCARDFFMLSFYLIGMNNNDIYKISKIYDGRIEYERSKTNRDYSIKVEPECFEIIENRKGKEKLIDIQERYKNIKS
ncbi:MAG: phage integrase SAM-like domain-containing protein [Marinifilaceae bacterium]|jgi:hypothetical protein|nr:phage integrase SAM-like domain-containing protein [Marinifilaceae bacterium]